MLSQNGNKEDDSNDEFDSLIDSKASYSERLGIDSSAGKIQHTGRFDSNFSHIYKPYSKFGLPYEDGSRTVMGVK